MACRWSGYYEHHAREPEKVFELAAYAASQFRKTDSRAVVCMPDFSHEGPSAVPVGMVANRRDPIEPSQCSGSSRSGATTSGDHTGWGKGACRKVASVQQRQRRRRGAAAGLHADSTLDRGLDSRSTLERTCCPGATTTGGGATYGLAAERAVRHVRHTALSACPCTVVSANSNRTCAAPRAGSRMPNAPRAHLGSLRE
eukprot:4985449-Prymnesium_polylepis.1